MSDVWNRFQRRGGTFTVKSRKLPCRASRTEPSSAYDDSPNRAYLTLRTMELLSIYPLSHLRMSLCQRSILTRSYPCAALPSSNRWPYNLRCHTGQIHLVEFGMLALQSYRFASLELLRAFLSNSSRWTRFHRFQVFQSHHLTPFFQPRPSRGS